MKLATITLTAAFATRQCTRLVASRVVAAGGRRGQCGRSIVNAPGPMRQVVQMTRVFNDATR